MTIDESREADANAQQEVETIRMADDAQLIDRPALALADSMGTGGNVVVLRWPGQAAAAQRLAEAGLPRLLLVEAGADPPSSGDCEEDWVRLPADDRDVAARLDALALRAHRHQQPPTLSLGRLLHHGEWIAISPTEQAILRPLVDRFGDVVTYETLVGAGWPDQAASPSALRVHLHRLRQRIGRLGLVLRSVRGLGVLLERGTLRPGNR